MKKILKKEKKNYFLKRFYSSIYYFYIYFYSTAFLKA